MADKNDSLSHLFKFFEFVITFRLKKHISHGKRFIHDQDFRLNVDGHCKRQTHKHTAGIRFYRLVYILSDIRKFQNIFHLFINFFLAEPDHSPVQIDILYAVIFHIKSGTQFQQCGNTPVHRYRPAGCIQNTCYYFENCGLSRTVCTDNAHAFTLSDGQIDSLKGMMLRVVLSAPESQSLPDAVRGLVVELIYFFHIRDLNRNVVHN